MKIFGLLTIYVIKGQYVSIEAVQVLVDITSLLICLKHMQL